MRATSRTLGIGRVSSALVVACACAVAGPIPSPAHGATATTGRLLVTLESDVAGTPKAQASAARSLLRRTGGRRARPAIPQLDTEVLAPPPGVRLSTFAAELRSQPGVERVEVERRHELRYVPNDPTLSTPEPRATAPDTSLQWWAARTGLFSAWDVTRGVDARVAIIDTGIDGNHPDLTGRITVAVDDDASGGGTATTDEIGHGTHVASLACGAGDNGVGLVGAGFGCKLLVYKTDLSDSSVARSIIAATDAGAQAINMSFGTDGSQAAPRTLVDAIDYAVERDVVLVAAAADEPVQEQGDPSNVLQPTGTGPDITAGRGLSVTAANFADRRANFAGLGSQISLAAYGAYNVSGGPPGLFGAFPGQTTSLERGGLFQPACGCRAALAGDARYAYLQGTSMAAPIVAATAALVRDVNPDIPGLGVVRLLKATASRPSGTGWTADLGWGILNAGEAVKQAQRVDLRPPRSKLRRPAKPKKGRITLRWTASDKATKPLKASGLRRVEIWRAANGRKPRKLRSSTKRKLTLKVKAGSRYDFWTIAVDKAGNREAAPKKPDARVRVPRKRR